MERAIAICVGGPLDGQHFSVRLLESGSPEPLTSRVPLAGCLYAVASPAELTDDTRRRFYGLLQDGELVAGTLEAHDEQWGHVAAFEYVPHEYTVTDGENGEPPVYTVGKAN